MNNEFTSSEALIQALRDWLPDSDWLPILNLLAIKGIADTKHLRDVTGWQNEAIRRRLDHLAGFPLNGSLLVKRLMKSYKRPGVAERPSTVYTLAEGGAKLLHAL